jgi:hypothetical protein
MNYEKLIKTISEMVENNDIEKRGLSLTYVLPEDIHNKMNEDLFYRMGNRMGEFNPTDIFEVSIEGILIKFIRKNETNAIQS